MLHASDLGSKKGLKKFKEGQKVAGKVLTVDTGGWVHGRVRRVCAWALAAAASRARCLPDSGAQHPPARTTRC